MKIPNKRVLVFSPFKRFVAIFHSSMATAKAFGVHTQSIRYACQGKTISCHNLYFRYANENVELEDDDLGKLTLTEYDELCDVKRKYYPTAKMERKGMKYNTQRKKARKAARKAAKKAAKEEEKRLNIEKEREEKEQINEQLKQELIDEIKNNQPL